MTGSGKELVGHGGDREHAPGSLAQERLRSGIKATAESFFGVFADPIVAEKISTSDFKQARNEKQGDRLRHDHRRLHVSGLVR